MFPKGILDERVEVGQDVIYQVDVVALVLYDRARGVELRLLTP